MVIVLVDALRADALGVYGSPRPGVSPHLDAMAASGAHFERAITPAAWTVPAVASLFTGLRPHEHGVLRFRHGERLTQDALAPERETLAERFDAGGYETGALLKSVVISADHGMAQGFDHFRVVPGAQAAGASAGELTDAALAWLSEPRAEKWFLYLHYMDPHTPYAAPGPRRFAPAGPTSTHEQVAQLKRGDRALEPGEAERLRALYDEEVAYVDAELGRLLAALHPDTVVMLVADHGEQLGEHGGWLHEHLWEENVRVPWIVRAPGVVDVEIRERVSTLDLGATALELAGLPHEGFGRSVSRAGALRGAPMSAAPVQAAYGERRALWEGDFKLIDGEPPMLFDLAADPTESRDLAAERPGEVARLRGLLGVAEAVPAPAVEVGDGRLEGLKALGYLE